MVRQKEVRSGRKFVFPQAMQYASISFPHSQSLQQLLTVKSRNIDYY
jgi:hypothetical protein